MFSSAYPYSEDLSLSAHLPCLIRGLVFGDPCLYIRREPSDFTDAQAGPSVRKAHMPTCACHVHTINRFCFQKQLTRMDQSRAGASNNESTVQYQRDSSVK